MEYIEYRGVTINYDATKPVYYVEIFTRDDDGKRITLLKARHKLLSVVKAAIDEYKKQYALNN